ncbi:MAG: hypothetical protein K6F98_01665 [Bacteroidales bacterium]|nr:hypothetical protein [Bacteroidales bacterium]
MRRLFYYAACLAGLLAATSCDDGSEDWIVDWAPVNVTIEAGDADGHSIISPDMPGMTLTFKGETYTVKDAAEPYQAGTKAYLAVMHGLLAVPVVQEEGETTYCLVFGEIDGAADMDEDIVLRWPDGSQDIIHYHCSDHKEGRHPTCDRSWKLNGVKYEGDTFRFSGKSRAIK